MKKKKIGCPVGTKKVGNKCIKVKKYYQQFQGVAAADTGEKIDIYTLEPTYAPARKITQEDVWGKVKESHWKNDVLIPTRRISKGLIVASSMKGFPDICPIWRDKVPFKSVTVVCRKEDEGDVAYWLEFVHGGGSISRRKKLPKGKVALRSDYQAW